MESESALAKLRRLRYRSDYSMRLFLAAIAETAWPEAGAWGRWRWARCPRCGHTEREQSRRRVRAN